MLFVGLPCLIIAFTTVAMWLIGFANTLRGPTRRVAARFRQ